MDVQKEKMNIVREKQLDDTQVEINRVPFFTQECWGKEKLDSGCISNICGRLWKKHTYEETGSLKKRK